MNQNKVSFEKPIAMKENGISPKGRNYIKGLNYDLVCNESPEKCKNCNNWRLDKATREQAAKGVAKCSSKDSPFYNHFQKPCDTCKQFEQVEYFDIKKWKEQNPDSFIDSTNAQSKRPAKGVAVGDVTFYPPNNQ